MYNLVDNTPVKNDKKDKLKHLYTTQRCSKNVQDYIHLLEPKPNFTPCKHECKLGLVNNIEN